MLSARSRSELACYLLSQRPDIDPNVLTPISIVGPIEDVSMIIIESVKPSNCSIIQGISIDQCCEPGEFTGFQYCG